MKIVLHYEYQVGKQVCMLSFEDVPKIQILAASKICKIYFPKNEMNIHKKKNNLSLQHTVFVK